MWERNFTQRQHDVFASEWDLITTFLKRSGKMDLPKSMFKKWESDINEFKNRKEADEDDAGTEK